MKSTAAGDVAFLTRDDNAALSEVMARAPNKPMRALLFAGRPLHEPVVARGPFVMNTEAEIEQAYVDYRAGRLWPGVSAAHDAPATRRLEPFEAERVKQLGRLREQRGFEPRTSL